MHMRRRRLRFRLLEFLVATAMTEAILSVGTPKARRGRLNAAEMSAGFQMGVVRLAQAQYRSQFGKYAATLAELGPRVANLIPGSLASGEKDGYRFVMTATPGGYTLVATPEVFGKTGRRTFFFGSGWGCPPELGTGTGFRGQPGIQIEGICDTGELVFR